MEGRKSNYFPHIDGLRAVAVLLVFLFHLAPNTFPAGYLGVDIFFVISGFVITQTLYKRYQETGKILLLDFYRRRFKRLYPPLLVMVLVTSIAYLFFGFLWDVNLYTKSAVSTILAFSNIYFLKQGENYFNQELINPLLHTWSLGIEEQFYFVYPLLLLVLLTVLSRSALRSWYLTLFFLILALLSFLSFKLGGNDLWGSYYFPLARFWELLAGCGLYFFAQSKPARSLTQWLSLAGIFLLAAIQLSFFSGEVHTETLLTVIASASIIYAGLNQKNLLIRALSLRSVVYVGLISYSLYLWHLPVIYFLNLYTPVAWQYILALPATLLFAAASYHFIEQKTRYALWLDKWFYHLLYVGAVAVFVLVGWLIMTSPSAIIIKVNNSLNQFSKEAGQLNYIESQYQLAARTQPDYFLGGISTAVYCSEDTVNPELNQFGLWKNCLKEKTGKNLYYLTGDSHGSHFVPMLDNSEVVDDVYFERFPRRALVNTDGPELNTDESIAKRAEQLRKLRENYQQIIYISSFHLTPSLGKLDILDKNIRRYIESLSPYAKLVFIGPTPMFLNSPQSCVILGAHCALHRKEDLAAQAGHLALLKSLAEEYPNVYLYDPYFEVCPEDTCYLFNETTGEVLYLDDDHLSAETSARLANHFDEWLLQTFVNGD